MKPVSLLAQRHDRAGLRQLATRLIEHLEALRKRPLLAERNLLARIDDQPEAVLERQRILQRAIDEIYFQEEIAAGGADYVGAVAEVMNGNAWSMRFPAGANTAALIVVPTKELWVATRPRITVWYTSAVGSTNTFNLRFALYTFGAGVTTTQTPLTVDWTAPGPAVANDILSTSAVITSARFPSSPSGVCRLQLSRFPTPDANANALDVLLALITFEETA